ncbi:MAG: hypothetical protein N3G18_02140, partial [Candidatus Saccharicenans sp.]|nr:hypothetical protein [Candidatus Saccharicenans sp.]
MARKARHGAGGQTARLLVGLLVFLSIAAPVISGPAGSVQKQGNPFLVGAYFQARQLKDQAEQAISRLEAEIQRNREVAAKSRKLMELAAQRSDDNARRAEQTAAQALKLAEESIARNEKTLARWQAAKSRAERSMGELMRMLKEGRPGEGAILGQVSSLGGRAQIFRRDGTTLNLEGDMPGFLSPGERIKTTDGPVEFRALGGRATAQLDRESELAVLDEKEDKECFELVKGRLHGLV